MAISNKLKTALKRISTSGGSVQGLASGLPYALDRSGKIIPSTTLEEATKAGYLARHTSGSFTTWRLTALGQTASASTPSTKKKPATASAAPARPPVHWKAAVRSIMKHTGFDEEAESETALGYSTRDNGDMEEDRAGAADIAHARALKKQIESSVPGTTAMVTTVDEWTSLRISHG